MRRLGYNRYVAQGGDWGAVGRRRDGPPGAEGLAGRSTSTCRDRAPGVRPPPRCPRTAGHRTRSGVRALTQAVLRGSGYRLFLEQATRPQTMGYALRIRRPAWRPGCSLDTDAYEKITRASSTGSRPERSLTRMRCSTTSRSTGSPAPATSAARLYWENGRAQALAAGQTPAEITLPVGFTIVPGRDLTGPRAAGSSAPIPPSPTSTRSTGAVTSPPGKSPNCSLRRSGRRSDRCASRRHLHGPVMAASGFPRMLVRSSERGTPHGLVCGPAANPEGPGSVPGAPHLPDGFTGTFTSHPRRRSGCGDGRAGHQQFAEAGHDTGMWIGYARAADHRDRVDRLAVAEAAMPGVVIGRSAGGACSTRSS